MDNSQGSRNQIKEVKQFKGLVTTVDSGELQIDVLEKAENVVFDIEGGARKREGFKKFTDKKLPKKYLTLKSANEIKLSPFKTEVAGYGLIKTTLTDDYLTTFKNDYDLTVKLYDADASNTGATTIISQIETNGVADISNIKSNSIEINYEQTNNTVNNDRLKIADSKTLEEFYYLKNKTRIKKGWIDNESVNGGITYSHSQTNVDGLERLSRINIGDVLSISFPDHTYESNDTNKIKDVAARKVDIDNNQVLSNLRITKISDTESIVSFDAILFTKILWPSNENSVNQSVSTSLIPMWKSNGDPLSRKYCGYKFFRFSKRINNGSEIIIDDINSNHYDVDNRILSKNNYGVIEDNNINKISQVILRGVKKDVAEYSNNTGVSIRDSDANNKFLFLKKDRKAVKSLDNINNEHNTTIFVSADKSIDIYDLISYDLEANKETIYITYNSFCGASSGVTNCRTSSASTNCNNFQHIDDAIFYNVDHYTLPSEELFDSGVHTVYELESIWTKDDGTLLTAKEKYLNSINYSELHNDLGVYSNWKLNVKSIAKSSNFLIKFNMNKEIASSDEELIKTMAAYQRSAGKNYIDQKIKYDVFTYSSEYFDNDNIHISIFGNGAFLKNINVSGGSKSFDTGISSSLVDEVECVELDDKIIITTGVKVFVVSILQNTNDIGTIEDCFVVSEINDLAETVGFIESSISGTNALGTSYDIDKANEVYGYAGVKILGVTVYNNTEKIDYSDLNSHDDFIFIPIIAHKDQNDTLTYQWKISVVDYVTKEVTELTSVNGVNASIDLDNPTLKPGLIFTDSTTYIFSLKVSCNNGKKTFEDSFTFNLLNNVLIDNKVVNTVDSRDTIDQINKCKFVTKLNNKILLYGNGTRNIYTSETNRPLYFPMNNIVYADSYGRKENILKISTYKDIGIIFTETSMMSLSGGGSILLNDPWRVLPLSGNHGTVTHNSTIEAENTIVFVYRDGIYLIEQLSVSEKRVSLINISFPINDLVLPYKDVVDKTDEKLYKGIHAFNLEGRLYFSYPENNYMLVYDYSLNGMEKGLWTVWKSNALNFWKLFKINNDEQMCVIDYNNRDSIWVKRPKVNTTIDSIDFPADFYKDGNRDIKFLIKTINSNMDMTWDAMKVKRLNIRTRNNKVDSGTYDVRITDNGIPIQSYTVDGVAYDNPTLGQMKLGKTLTSYRPSDNISQKVFMTSKSARELSIEIENESSLPFEVTGMFVEYCESKIKPTKLR